MKEVRKRNPTQTEMRQRKLFSVSAFVVFLVHSALDILFVQNVHGFVRVCVCNVSLQAIFLWNIQLRSENFLC